VDARLARAGTRRRAGRLAQLPASRLGCHHSRLQASIRFRPRMKTNNERAFEDRPEAHAAWGQLNGVIKAGMDLRRYELATFAAARRLRSSYCCLAHGTVLLERFGEPVRHIPLPHHPARLDPARSAAPAP